MGAWVEGLVGDALAERTEQIADIERDDTGSSRRAPSAMISIAPGIPLLGLAPQRSEPRASPGTSSRKAARAEHTALTRPTGRNAKTTTAPTSPMLAAAPAPDAVAALASPAAPVAEARTATASQVDSPAAVPETPRRGPQRALLVVAVLAIGVGVAGASVLATSLRTGLTATAPSAAPAPIRPASPAPSAVSPPSSGWIPVMPLNASDTEGAAGGLGPVPSANVTQGGLQGNAQGRKWPGAQAPSARPGGPAATPVTTTAAAPPASAGAKAASCDPPFWIDADGTKRYYRHCTNP